MKNKTTNIEKLIQEIVNGGKNHVVVGNMATSMTTVYNHISNSIISIKNDKR